MKRGARTIGWKGLAVLMASAFLASCRPGEGGETRVMVIGERQPRLIDPASTNASPADLVLIENAAEGLVRFDAAGNIAPALAQRWAVSDDGLSYVFRLRPAQWSDGRAVRARDVVRLLQRSFEASGRNPLRDTVGAVRQVVAMTDRVVAIELSGPRPHFLQLLAQPQFGLVRNGQGAGPFAVERSEEGLRLVRTLPGPDGEEGVEEVVSLSASAVEPALTAFLNGKADMVLGGSTGDLALALGSRLPRNTLRIDPVAGLFGLLPERGSRLAARRDLRALLDEAIDRQALVAALGVPQLRPRTSLLQAGLDGVSTPFEPQWTSLPLAERRGALVERARSLLSAERDGEETPITLRLRLPAGPGGAIIRERLQADWAPLGFAVEAVTSGAAADFRWLDVVAPSTSPAWFLRSFRCDVVAICVEDADQLLDAARQSGFTPQRNGFFAQAEQMMREEVLFVPVAAPIRWSLVARSITTFSENRFARHPLTDLRSRGEARD